MKVGVLTYHNTNNFGASLQAYALCRAISKLGYDCEIIDYQNKKMREDLKNAYLRRDNSLKGRIHHEIVKSGIERRKNAFRNFKNNYMNLGKKSYSVHEELIVAEKEYDKIITGSDQVWNYNINDDDYSFFLDFCKNSKKMSYAASFGLSDIDEGHRLKVKNCLADIPYISVRETRGMEIVEELTNRKDTVLVCDPTLLLKKNDWSIFDCGNKYGSYILIYCFGYSETLYSAAEKMSAETGYRLVVIDGSLKNKFRINKDSAIGIGPKEWVSLFLNARCVFTNSFHGTAFSINFNKPFFTELLKTNTKINSRLTNILEYLKLEDRIITDNTRFELENGIDYNKVNERLEALRDESVKFLSNALGDKR